MDIPAELITGLARGALIPFLGPELLQLVPDNDVPASPEALVAKVVAKVSVPYKIRTRLTPAAQFIENFKHRKTLVAQMNAAFAAEPRCSRLQRRLAALRLPLIVDCWYDASMATALAEAGFEWAQIQALAQSEHYGQWFARYESSGVDVDAFEKPLPCLLYKPIGCVSPASNYLVSDSDFVEVLTVIDIQIPIPNEVQSLRRGRGFLFLGYRFNDQVNRNFARQIMKRSAGPYWAVLPETPTRMEACFLAEQGISRIEMPLPAFADELEKALCVRGT